MEHFETEEQQVEALKKWWKENGISVVAGVVLGLSLLMGWRWWQTYSEQQAHLASGLYEQVQLFLTSDQTDKAVGFAEKLLSEHSGSTYAVLAVLNLARLDLEKEDIDSSHVRLQWILDQNGSLSELTHIARLRKARLYLSEEKLAKASRLIEGVDVGEFKGAYAELRGDIAVAEARTDAARTAYTEALEGDELSGKHREWVQIKLDDLGVKQVARIDDSLPLSVAGNPSTVQENVITDNNNDKSVGDESMPLSVAGNPSTVQENVITDNNNDKSVGDESLPLSVAGNPSTVQENVITDNENDNSVGDVSLPLSVAGNPSTVQESVIIDN